MGSRGRPSLKISSEERLERRRAQLAESQRKCRARKRASRAGKEGSRSNSASGSPQEAMSASTDYEMEERGIEAGNVEDLDSSLHQHTGTNRESVAVSDVAPASDSDLNNQVLKAHSADMKREQAVVLRDSTELQPWSSDLDSLLDGKWEGLIDTRLLGFEYDDYIQPNMTIGTPGEYADQSPDTFCHSSYGLSQTDDSPLLSPLTLPFPQGAVPFTQHHSVGSTPADFVLFDLDQDIWNMITPDDAHPNFDTLFQDSPTYQSKSNGNLPTEENYAGVPSPTSDFDATMSEFMVCS